MNGVMLPNTAHYLHTHTHTLAVSTRNLILSSELKQTHYSILDTFTLCTGIIRVALSLHERVNSIEINVTDFPLGRLIRFSIFISPFDRHFHIHKRSETFDPTHTDRHTTIFTQYSIDTKVQISATTTKCVTAIQPPQQCPKKFALFTRTGRLL